MLVSYFIPKNIRVPFLIEKHCHLLKSSIDVRDQRNALDII